ncbi:MAG: type II secretion system F family protein [Pseudomonadota bacterium]
MPTEIPFGLTPTDIATIASAIAAFALCIAFWNTLTVRDPMRGRVKSLQLRRDELRAGLLKTNNKSRLRKQTKVDMLRRIGQRFSVLQAEQLKKIEEKMLQAGWRGKDAPVVFAFAKLGMPLGLGLFGLVFVSWLNVFQLEPGIKFIATVGTIIAGFMLPDIYLKNVITKRMDAIRLGLPDGLDLMVICAEAGLTLDASLSRVARELGTAYPELCDELTLTAIELGFLTERRIALENLAKRVELPNIRSVVTTLIQTEKYGTPLASSLRVLSAEFRNERMMKAEEKAARLPAVMTVPLILFIMPTLFVVLIGPATCKISDEFINR